MRIGAFGRAGRTQSLSLLHRIDMAGDYSNFWNDCNHAVPYFVLEGTVRLRVDDQTLTVPKYGGVLVGPDQLRQVFNDTDAEVLWLIIGAPEELEFLQGSKSQMDLSLIYPVDPKQLPKELDGVDWPPKG